MHRSGTSAVTRGLQLLGINLGDSLLPPVPGDNDKGFWEDQDIYQLNERLLSRLNTSWHALRPISAEELLSPELQPEREQALAILQERTATDAIFAFKDPRTSILLPFWQDVFRRLEIADAYVVAIRNPLSVAASLHQRNQIEQEKALCLWVKYTLAGARYTRDKPTVVIDYDLMLENPVHHLQRIAAALSLPPIDASSAEVRQYTDEFLSKKLRHSQHDHRVEKVTSPGVPGELYAALIDSADEHSRFDAYKHSAIWDVAEQEFAQYPDLFAYIDGLTTSTEQSVAAVAEAQKLQQLAEKRWLASKEQQEKVEARYQDLAQRHKATVDRQDEFKTTIAVHGEKMEQAKVGYNKLKQRYLDLLGKEKELQKTLRLKQEEISRISRTEDDLRKTLEEVKRSRFWNGEVWRERVESLRHKAELLQEKHLDDVVGAPKALVRKAWSSAPLSFSARVRLKNQLFEALPWVFSRTATYRIWASGKGNPARTAPVARPAVALQPIAPTGKAGARSVASAIATDSIYGDVIITSWMAVDDPMIDGLVQLARQLGELGISATFVGNVELFQRRKWPSCQRHSLLLSDASYPPGATELATPWWIEQIYATESAWLRGNGADVVPENVQRKCLQAFYYWANAFTASRPVCVLIWGTTAPLSRLHLMLCKMMTIPYMILERGHFVGTLLVDCIGHSFTSEKVARLADVKLAPAGSLDKILAWEKSVDEKVPYGQYNADVGKKLAQRLGASDKKIILYIGANDAGSGCAREAPDPEQCSFMFHRTYDAVASIHSFLAQLFPDCILVIKQHPADKHDYRVFTDDNTLLAEGMNINQLIKMADVCVSTSTTAFAKCIIEKKPIVSLAASDISLKNITYECNDITAIPVMLRAALDGDGYQQKQQNGLNFLYGLFDASLIGVDESIPTRLKIDDLSRMIYRRMIARSSIDAKPIRPLVGQAPAGVVQVRGDEAVDVVVPVYRDVATTRRCLDSLLAARSAINYRIVVVNDHSPEPEVHALLRQYQQQANLVLLENAINLGFTGAVNRGLSLSSTRDVVVLNSDTIVSNNWLDRLYQHAHSATHIGTVTPLSNNASIFSIRNAPVGYDLPDDCDIGKLDQDIAASNAGGAVEVPVGHGFCLFIKRTCLDKVGYLDQVTFGKGYSEEVDFCLRARKYGFVHLCAADTFVAHVGGVSFQESGNSQRLKNRQVIQQRYPGYFAEIEAFIQRDPIAKYRPQ
jgi:GT2 family glycosyltransferase